jgi:hypothetical protein
VRRALIRLAWALLLCLGTSACAGVPDILFEEAGTDGRRVDAGVDGARAADGGGDAAVDTGPRVGCPWTAPEGGVCCGSNLCLGDCGKANCNRCVLMCSEAQLCCATNTQKVQCRSPSMSNCH